MTSLHVPRFYLRQLVLVSTVYLYPDEPTGCVLARVEAIHHDPCDLLAPSYTVRVVTGGRRGHLHAAQEVALSPLGRAL